MTMASAAFGSDDVQSAIDKMMGLRDGDLGVVDAVCCGRRAIPALRHLLFWREPSGIYQPRCWAVRALSILGAFDVLLEYLKTRHTTRDPVERAGDDAVINAAARHLSVVREEHVFRLLLELARDRHRSGVIAALAAFHREESIPLLVDALAEDDCRLTAEPALAAFGKAALPSLLQAAVRKSPPGICESERSIRQRQGALRLMIDIGVPPGWWPQLRGLVLDKEPRIAVLASELCLVIAPRQERGPAVQRLIGLLNDADWRLEDDIEKCLLRHCHIVGPLAGETLREADMSMQSAEIPSAARAVVSRVKDRAAHRRFRGQG
jgi:hypothetical protein